MKEEQQQKNVYHTFQFDFSAPMSSNGSSTILIDNNINKKSNKKKKKEVFPIYRTWKFPIYESWDGWLHWVCYCQFFGLNTFDYGTLKFILNYYGELYH